MKKLAKQVIKTDRSKSFVQNATDTFTELGVIFAGLIVVGGGAYMLFESKGFFESIWWAIVTAFTVGYGDSVPATVGGRVVASLLMSISIFIVVPLITARMASRMIVDDNAFTNEEQQHLQNTATRINKYLDTVEKKPAKKTATKKVEKKKDVKVSRSKVRQK